VCTRMKNYTFNRKVINDYQSTYNYNYKKSYSDIRKKKIKFFFLKRKKEIILIKKNNNKKQSIFLCGLLITINVHNSTNTTHTYLHQKGMFLGIHKKNIVGVRRSYFQILFFGSWHLVVCTCANIFFFFFFFFFCCCWMELKLIQGVYKDEKLHF